MTEVLTPTPPSRSRHSPSVGGSNGPKLSLARRDSASTVASQHVTDGVPYLGKNGLLEWISDFIGRKVSCVEECFDGINFLNVHFVMNPSGVDMRKVLKNARSTKGQDANFDLLKKLSDQQGISMPRNLTDSIREGDYKSNLQYLSSLYKCYFQKHLWKEKKLERKRQKEAAAAAGTPHSHRSAASTQPSLPEPHTQVPKDKVSLDETSAELLDAAHAFHSYSTVYRMSSKPKSKVMDGMIDLVRQRALRVVSADYCAVYLLDESTNELWTTNKVAPKLSTPENVLLGDISTLKRVSEIRIGMGKGIVGLVASSAQAMNFEDIPRDHAGGAGQVFSTPDGTVEELSPDEHRLSCVLCIPIKSTKDENTCIGVIEVGNLKSDPFPREDEVVLEALAAQAALAIENSKVLHSSMNSLKYIETAFGSIQMTVFTLGPRGELKTSNHPLEPLFGYSDSEMKMESYEDWIRPNNPRLAQDIRRAYDRGGGPYKGKRYMLHGEGDPIPVTYTITCLDGPVRGVCVLIETAMDTTTSPTPSSPSPSSDRSEASRGSQNSRPRYPKKRQNVKQRPPSTGSNRRGDGGDLWASTKTLSEDDVIALGQMYLTKPKASTQLQLSHCSWLGNSVSRSTEIRKDALDPSKTEYEMVLVRDGWRASKIREGVAPMDEVLGLDKKEIMENDYHGWLAENEDIISDIDNVFKRGISLTIEDSPYFNGSHELILTYRILPHHKEEGVVTHVSLLIQNVRNPHFRSASVFSSRPQSNARTHSVQSSHQVNRSDAGSRPKSAMSGTQPGPGEDPLTSRTRTSTMMSRRRSNDESQMASSRREEGMEGKEGTPRQDSEGSYHDHGDANSDHSRSDREDDGAQTRMEVDIDNVEEVVVETKSPDIVGDDELTDQQNFLDNVDGGEDGPASARSARSEAIDAEERDENGEGSEGGEQEGGVTARSQRTNRTDKSARNTEHNESPRGIEDGEENNSRQVSEGGANDDAKSEGSARPASQGHSEGDVEAKGGESDAEARGEGGTEDEEE